MRILNTYIEITEGKPPQKVQLLVTQNTKDGGFHKLYNVTMDDYKVQYVESLDSGSYFVYKATIRNIIEIFGPEETEKLYTKQEIEDSLQNE